MKKGARKTHQREQPTAKNKEELEACEH